MSNQEHKNPTRQHPQLNNRNTRAYIQNGSQDLVDTAGNNLTNDKGKQEPSRAVNSKSTYTLGSSQ